MTISAVAAVMPVLNRRPVRRVMRHWTNSSISTAASSPDSGTHGSPVSFARSSATDWLVSSYSAAAAGRMSVRISPEASAR